MSFIVHVYEPIPEFFTLPIAQWEQFIQSICPTKHGVAWNLKHTYPPDLFTSRNEPLTEPLNVKRIRRLRANEDIAWTAEYVCHRAGSKRVRKDRHPGGITGKTRPLQKASKKIGCVCRLSVTCSHLDPGNVSLRLHGNHNHTIGSVDDLQFLSLSSTVRELVALKLAEGYRRRDIRRSLQRQLGNSDSTDANPPAHRDKFIHDQDIYNIWLRVQNDFHRRADDEKESVLIWLNELRQKQYSTFEDEDFARTMSFGFCCPRQRQLLQSSEAICLDATHDVSIHSHGILYTIVVRHPITGGGYPVSYLFTLDHTSRPLKNWLAHNKDLGLRPLKITIDCSNVEGNALADIYPGIPVQWCAFHVGRALWHNLNTRVTGEAAKDDRKAMMSHLKDIMWKKDPAEARSQLLAFQSAYSTQPTFLEYFNRQWVKEGRFEKWTAAHQPNFETNMETNNYVESWHNQLKTFYLERRRNRRVDRLIYILVQDVQFDMEHNVERATHNIGRMSAAERKARARELAAESIPSSMLDDVVHWNVVNGNMSVASLSSPDERYTISLQDEEIMRCECQDFTYRRAPCKHMFLAKRAHPQLTMTIHHGEF